MKLLLCSLVALAAFAAEAPKPILQDPLKDMRADLAILQRDYLLAKAESDAAQLRANEAQKKMLAKNDEAVAACKGAGETIDFNALKCVPTPAEKTK